MEMPEGWKNWVASVSADHPENLMGKEERFRADLMREMADALEETIDDLGGAASSDADDALKKFKEWK